MKLFGGKRNSDHSKGIVYEAASNESAEAVEAELPGLEESAEYIESPVFIGSHGFCLL